jgi:hypothetical protein
MGEFIVLNLLRSLSAGNRVAVTKITPAIKMHHHQDRASSGWIATSTGSIGNQPTSCGFFAEVQVAFQFGNNSWHKKICAELFLG